jgi:cysteine-rich repeat protein
VQRRERIVKRAFGPLVLSIAFAAACGRTNPADWLVDPDMDAGEGGVARGGGAGKGAGGATGGVSGVGGTPATGGRGGAGIGGMLAGSGGGGRGGASGSGGKAPVCGDGIVGMGEACEPGSQPTAPALEIRQGAWRMPIGPLVGPTTATAHYAYDSRSSHTGFEAPEKSGLYLYRWDPESALSLVILNGIDQDSSGLIQPLSAIVFEFAGLPDTAVVVISDDDVEFARTTPTTARADWDCNRNSDGGLIAGLAFPGSWHLTITPSFLAGITTWSFFSGGQGSDLGVQAEIPLDLSQPIEILASDTVVGCRDDCTVPRCGDGILDPGEVCDDGNEEAGDGCYGCRPD